MSVSDQSCGKYLAISLLTVALCCPCPGAVSLLQMRSSALTVVHVVPMVALGSTAPLMALGFVAKTGSLTSSAFVNIIMAAVTFAAVVWQAWKSSAGLRF